MHKYLPKLYVIPLKKEQANMSQELLLRQFEDLGIPEYSEEFTFPETAFITVTAYQNQQVSSLFNRASSAKCGRIKNFLYRTSL